MIEYNLNLEASQLFDGEIELDEIYFDKATLEVAARVSMVVEQVARLLFGLLKRNGKVFVVVVKDTKTDMLMPIITRKSSLKHKFTQIVMEVTMLLI